MELSQSWVCVGAGAPLFLDGLIFHRLLIVVTVGPSPVSVSPLRADVFPMKGWADGSEKEFLESKPVSAGALAEEKLRPEG